MFTEVAALFSFGFLVCVSLQVLFRYVLEEPLPWSEELARYLFRDVKQTALHSVKTDDGETSST